MFLNRIASITRVPNKIPSTLHGVPAPRVSQVPFPQPKQSYVRPMTHLEFNNNTFENPRKGQKKLVGISVIAGGVLGALLYKHLAAGNPEYAQSQTRATPDQSVSGHTPGDPLSTKSSVLCAGANILQGFAPINSIHISVCGIHHYAGDIKRQVEAHHFCSHINEDVHQCVIYDSSQPNARLIGVEYIISKKIFDSLPKEEKKLWHSHSYDKSGLLIAPSLPELAEDQLMDHLVNTYGKTFHMWQIDRGDALPLGVPQLMMAITDDSELDLHMVQRRDKEFNVSMAEKRKRRQHLQDEPVSSGANYFHSNAPDFYKVVNYSK
jgi:hypothetical protein